MDFSYTAEDEAFREELRGWLDEHLPKFLADWGGDDDGGGRSSGAPSRSPVAGESAAAAAEREAGIARTQERRKDWQRRLNAGRWAAINWPRDWNGREATPVQNVIYSEEMARQRAPGIYNANGIWQIGPMIIAWGTEEQQQQWLPGILSAEEHWCQGFSEPQAGSDLANLRTTAIRATSSDGRDEYVVNGQKIWISTAHLAKWGLFLLRTDPGAIERGAKHEGITAFIIDMETPGIECRPIRDIVGDEMFNEVWFTDARIPAAHRLGDEGQGWQVAMGTLGRERVGTAGLAITMAADLRAMISAARSVNPDSLEDPEIRERIARAYTDIEFTKLLNYRALTKIIRGQKNWPEVPLAKLQWSHLAQTLAELAVDLLGTNGLRARGGPDAIDNGSWTRLYRFQRYTSIGAGATEVQKNIIADRALLPRK